MPIEKISEIIGVEENYIVRPKPGRHSYDNMVSYLIHIKYPEKHQYRADCVVTLTGPDYMKIYSESRRTWMRGRAEKVIADAIPTYKELKVMISEGSITEEELYDDPRYALLLTEHLSDIDKMFENRAEILFRKTPEAKAMRVRSEDWIEKKRKDARSYLSYHGYPPETWTDIDNKQNDERQGREQKSMKNNEN